MCTQPADPIRPIDGAENFNVEGRTIVLVDDVINSGWTVQRAMATLWQRGRPAAVKLAVLIDRGHRAAADSAELCRQEYPDLRAATACRCASPSGRRIRQTQIARSRDDLLDRRIAQGTRGGALNPIVLSGGRVIDPANATRRRVRLDRDRRRDRRRRTRRDADEFAVTPQ